MATKKTKAARSAIAKKAAVTRKRRNADKKAAKEKASELLAD